MFNNTNAIDPEVNTKLLMTLYSVNLQLQSLSEKNPIVGFSGINFSSHFLGNEPLIPRNQFVSDLQRSYRHLTHLPKKYIPIVDLEATYVPDKLYITYTAGFFKSENSAFHTIRRETTCFYLPYKKLERFLKRVVNACTVML